MNQQTLEQIVTDLAKPVLTQYFITDPDVVQRVVLMMIEDGVLFDTAGVHFDPDSLRDELDKLGEFSVKRHVIDINVGLNLGQKTELQAQFPGTTLLFEDNPRAPHGYAWAQKRIYTQMIRDNRPKKYDRMIDIGGNPVVHPHTLGLHVHCCTLRQGEMEEHRHVQHQVLTEVDSTVFMSDFCTNGVENCDHKAGYGMSIHALPNINPAFWPDIMERHDFELTEHFFHYQPELATGATAGFISDVNMWWRDKDGMVEFYFEADSSNPYYHRRSWCNEYARPWVRVHSSGKFAAVNTVEYMAHGGVKCNIRRVEMSTLSEHEQTEPLLWIGGTGTVHLPCPVFDPTLGYSDKDPRGYNQINIATERRLYNHVMNKCISNDTGRPDTPLTFNETLESVQVFNRVRALNGAEMTSRVQLSSTDVSLSARALYIAALRSVAQGRLAYGRYTLEMKRMQARWGVDSLMVLIKNCFSATVAYPYIWLSNTVSDAIDVVAVLEYFSNVNAMVGVPVIVQPYIPLPESSWSVGKDRTSFGTPDHNIEWKPPTDPVDIKEVGELITMLGQDLAPEVKERLDRDGVVPVPLEPFEHVIQSETRDMWHTRNDELKEQLRHVPNPVVFRPEDKYTPEVATPREVMAFAAMRIYEFNLYCVDTAIKLVESLQDITAETATVVGPSVDLLNKKAIQTGVNMYYTREVNGKIQHNGEFTHMAVFDPFKREVLAVVHRDGGSYVTPTAHGWVLVHPDLEIYNNKRLADASLKAYKITPVHQAKFSLFDGIAGVGKTYQFEEMFTLDDVYVTGPRLNADKFLAAMIKKSPANEREFRFRIRSADSALLQQAAMPRAARLFVDEGLMLHSGAWRALVQFVKPAEVIVAGDAAQLRFIPRSSSHLRIMFATQQFWDEYTRDTVSKRVPGRVAWIIANKVMPEVKDEVFTLNPCLGELSWKVVPDESDPAYDPPDPHVKSMTVLQACKSKQIAKPGMSDGKAKRGDSTAKGAVVVTAHEAQGDTYNVARMVRMHKYNAPLFTSIPHHYVAISRTKYKFDYVSIVKDMMCSWIEEANAQPESEIRKYMKPTPDWLMERVRSDQESLKSLGVIVDI